MTLWIKSSKEDKSIKLLIKLSNNGNSSLHFSKDVWTLLIVDMSDATFSKSYTLKIPVFSPWVIISINNEELLIGNSLYRLKKECISFNISSSFCNSFWSKMISRLLIFSFATSVFAKVTIISLTFWNSNDS